MKIKDKITALLYKKSKPKQKTLKKAIGDIGEEVACEYLEARGYKITARNVQISHRELDIIAENDYIILICEVKTSSSSKEYALSCSHRASEQIDKDKAENILFATRSYLQTHYSGKEVRIDVIEVYLGGSSPEIVHTENAINKLMLNRRRR